MLSVAALFYDQVRFMNDEKDSKEDLFHPIEAGKTFHMPEAVQEGGQIFTDHYSLQCDHLDVQPKSIVLPKFIFNPGMGYKEKGLLLLAFDSNHKVSIFEKVLKASEKGFKKFHIQFLDETGEEVVSTWKFEGARIQAVDFGFVAKERPSPAELAVEIDYKHLVIGDMSI